MKGLPSSIWSPDLTFVSPFQFEGSEGDKLIEVGATFTKRQKFTIAELKERRHRDHKLEAFLSDIERHKECRRQGLQGWRTECTTPSRVVTNNNLRWS